MLFAYKEQKLIVQFKQALQDHYQQYLKLPRLFSEETEVDIAKSFINLALLKKQAVQDIEKKWGELYQGEKWIDDRVYSHESLYQEHSSHPLDRLFLPANEQEKAPESVLVWGRAGIGKSILCQYLATQHGDNKTLPHLSEQFQIVIWLRLREVITDFSAKNPASWNDGDDLFWQILRKYFLTKRFWKKEETQKKDALLDWMENNASQILILCDGYDEIAGSEKKYPWIMDLFETIFKMGRVLLTSRPMAIHIGHNRQFDRELECIGFTSEDIEEYISLYLENAQKESDIPALINYLRSHPNLWGLAHIPINLELICWIWKKNKLTTSVHTMSGLYEEIVGALKERNEDDNKQPLSLTPKLKEHALTFLAVLAHAAMQEKDVVLLPRKFVKAKLEAYQGEYAKDIEPSHILAGCLQLGLLKSTGKVESYSKTLPEYYCFVHLSFQEFFAARYYKQHFLQPIQGKSEAILIECMQNKYEPRYQLIWWFLSGLLFQAGQNNPAYQVGLQQFWQALHTFPQDAIGTYHLALLAHCLDECEAADICSELKTSLEQQATVFIAWLNDETIVIPNQWFLALTRCPNVLGKLVQENFSRVNLTRLIDLLQRIQFLPSQIQAIMFQQLKEETTPYQDKIEIAGFLSSKPQFLNEAIVEKLFEFLEETQELIWASALAWASVAEHLADYALLTPSRLTVLLKFYGQIYDIEIDISNIIRNCWENLQEQETWDDNIFTVIEQFLENKVYSDCHGQFIQLLCDYDSLIGKISKQLQGLLLNEKNDFKTRAFLASSLLRCEGLSPQYTEDIWQFFRNMTLEEYNSIDDVQKASINTTLLTGDRGKVFVAFLSDKAVNIQLHYRILKDLYQLRSYSTTRIHEETFLQLQACLVDSALEALLRVDIGLLLCKLTDEPTPELIRFLIQSLSFPELMAWERQKIVMNLFEGHPLNSVDGLEETLFNFLQDIGYNNVLSNWAIQKWCKQKTISFMALIRLLDFFTQERSTLVTYGDSFFSLLQKSRGLIGRRDLLLAIFQDKKENSVIKRCLDDDIVLTVQEEAILLDLLLANAELSEPRWLIMMESALYKNLILPLKNFWLVVLENKAIHYRARDEIAKRLVHDETISDIEDLIKLLIFFYRATCQNEGPFNNIIRESSTSIQVILNKAAKNPESHEKILKVLLDHIGYHQREGYLSRGLRSLDINRYVISYITDYLNQFEYIPALLLDFFQDAKNIKGHMREALLVNLINQKNVKQKEKLLDLIFELNFNNEMWLDSLNKNRETVCPTEEAALKWVNFLVNSDHDRTINNSLISQSITGIAHFILSTIFFFQNAGIFYQYWPWLLSYANNPIFAQVMREALFHFLQNPEWFKSAVQQSMESILQAFSQWIMNENLLATLTLKPSIDMSIYWNNQPILFRGLTYNPFEEATQTISSSKMALFDSQEMFLSCFWQQFPAMVAKSTKSIEQNPQIINQYIHNQHVNTLSPQQAQAANMAVTQMLIPITYHAPSSTSYLPTQPGEKIMPTLKHENAPFKDYAGLVAYGAQLKQQLPKQLAPSLISAFLMRPVAKAPAVQNYDTFKNMLMRLATEIKTRTAEVAGLPALLSFQEEEITRNVLNRFLQALEDDKGDLPMLYAAVGNAACLLQIEGQAGIAPQLPLALMERLLGRVEEEMKYLASATSASSLLALQATALLVDVLLVKGMVVNQEFQNKLKKTIKTLNKSFRKYRNGFALHDFWGQYLVRSLDILMLELTPERESALKKHGVGRIAAVFGHVGEGLLYAGCGTASLGIAIALSASVGAFELLPGAIIAFGEGWAKLIYSAYKMGKSAKEAHKIWQALHPESQALPAHLAQAQTLSHEEEQDLKAMWTKLSAQLTVPVSLEDAARKVALKESKVALKKAKDVLAKAKTQPETAQATAALNKARADLAAAKAPLNEAIYGHEQQVYAITELMLQAKATIPVEITFEEKVSSWLVSLYQAHAARPHVQQFILWRILVLLNEQWAALPPSIDNEAIQTEDFTNLIKKLLGASALEASECAEAIDYYNRFIKSDKNIKAELIKSRKTQEKDFFINHLKSNKQKRQSYIAYGQLLDNFQKTKLYLEVFDSQTPDMRPLQAAWFQTFPKDEAIYTALGHYQKSQQLAEAIAELEKKGPERAKEKEDKLQLHAQALGRVKRILEEAKSMDTTLLSDWGCALLHELSDVVGPQLAALEEAASVQQSAMIHIAKGAEVNVGHQHWGDIFRFSQLNPDEASQLDAALKANKREDEKLRQRERIKPTPVMAVFGKLSVLTQQFGNIMEQQQSAAERIAADEARNAQLAEQMQQAFKLPNVPGQQASSAVPHLSVGQVTPKVGGSPIHSLPKAEPLSPRARLTATTEPEKYVDKETTKACFRVWLNFNALKPLELDDDQMNSLAEAIKTYLGKRTSLFKKNSAEISDAGDYICAGFSTEEAATDFRKFVEQQVSALKQAQKLPAPALGK